MAERYTLRFNLFDGDEMRTSLSDAISWLQELESKVPAEYRADATFEIEQEHDYYGGSSSLSVRVFYERPETDEEMADRIAHDAENAAAARAMNEKRERAIYEELRRKFG